jgi:hypothetical protein
MTGQAHTAATRARTTWGAQVRLALFGLALTACAQHSLVGVVPDAGFDTDDAGGDDESTPDANLPAETDGGGAILELAECMPGGASGLDAATIAALRSVRDGAALRWLYPYEGTVLPRGLGAPLLQWEGPAPEAALVRLSSAAFRYEGCVPLKGLSELTLEPRVWLAAEAASEGPTDALSVEVFVLAQGTAHGPVRTQLSLSTARVRGSVYYQTYNSPLAPRTSVASVLRVPLGGKAQPLFAEGSCNGCHSLARSGVALVASIDGAGKSFTLSAGAPTPLLGPTARLPGAEFAAVHPSGPYYVATAHPVGTSGINLRSFGADRQTNSALFSLDSGALVPAAGVPTQATMPAFSRDGLALVFNDAADAAGHSLSVASFDPAMPAFGAARRIFVDDVNYPGWPAFLPHDDAVVFALGSSATFSADGARLFGNALAGRVSSLAWVDVQTGQSRMLHRSGGYASADDAQAQRSYLPFGADEAGRSYYPTVMVTEPGSHEFVCFDSIRHYGARGLRRAIWCSALDGPGATAPPGDPSHPAFYLPGQEDTTENFRPMAAADAP